MPGKIFQSSSPRGYYIYIYCTELNSSQLLLIKEVPYHNELKPYKMWLWLQYQSETQEIEMFN